MDNHLETPNEKRRKDRRCCCDEYGSFVSGLLNSLSELYVNANILGPG